MMLTRMLCCIVACAMGYLFYAGSCLTVAALSTPYLSLKVRE